MGKVYLPFRPSASLQGSARIEVSAKGLRISDLVTLVHLKIQSV